MKEIAYAVMLILFELMNESDHIEQHAPLRT